MRYGPLPPLIGITGRAQHGKDTVGNWLVEQYGYTKFGFADALRSMALTIDPYVTLTGLRLSNLVNNYGWENAKQNGEVRRILQVLGTEGVRGHMGEDAWVNALQRKLEGDYWTFTSDDWEWINPVVITDVRFPNEAEWIENMYGHLWRVKRESLVRVWPDREDSKEERVPFDNGLGCPRCQYTTKYVSADLCLACNGTGDHPSEAHVDSLETATEFTALGVDELLGQVETYVKEGVARERSAAPH